MRFYILVAGLVLSVMGGASATVVDKGADVQKACRLYVQSSVRDQDEARSAGACAGMMETAMLFAPDLPAKIRGCPPSQGSVLESAKVLLRYLDNNPARLSAPGITIAIEAFRDAWPCQGDDAQPATMTPPSPKKRVPSRPRQAQQQSSGDPHVTGTPQ